MAWLQKQSPERWLSEYTTSAPLLDRDEQYFSISRVLIHIFVFAFHLPHTVHLNNAKQCTEHKYNNVINVAVQKPPPPPWKYCASAILLCTISCTFFLVFNRNNHLSPASSSIEAGRALKYFYSRSSHTELSTSLAAWPPTNLKIHQLLQVEK